MKCESFANNLPGEIIRVDVTVESMPAGVDADPREDYRPFSITRKLGDLITLWDIKLGDYGIKHDSSLLMVGRRPGGGPGSPDEDDEMFVIPRLKSIERIRPSMRQKEDRE